MKELLLFVSIIFISLSSASFAATQQNGSITKIRNTLMCINAATQCQSDCNNSSACGFIGTSTGFCADCLESCLAEQRRCCSNIGLGSDCSGKTTSSKAGSGLQNL
jgi:hypothetical protein